MSKPIRTCVGCGGRAEQAVLRRFVAGTDGLRLDGGRRAPGRGAYLHADPACWAAFVRRRGVIRSLRSTPTPAERAHLVAALAPDARGSR